MAGDAEGHIFEALKGACAADWRDYMEHAFVRGLGDGSLPEACFRHYLAQDYVFLIHFARAYALAAYKSDYIDDMRQAASTLDALINQELSLHLGYCRGWGLDEAALLATPEDPANLAYTRFVLEKGLAGDLLDLLVALAPCVLGYGEIGRRMMHDPGGVLHDNPYRAWIEAYAGPEYQAVAASAAAQLDRVTRRRLGERFRESPRWPGLERTFAAATRLEVGFWDMGLGAA
jgi:thiaminase/transcriptional activator TenA